MCALVAHLPNDAAVWRLHDPNGALTRVELLLAATERRVTALWAIVAVALGQDVTDAELAEPLNSSASPTVDNWVDRSSGGAELKSLREIALWMRGN